MTRDIREPGPAIDGGDADSAGTDGLTVGRAAALVGISVRTLHHWDDVGLVRPSGRTWAGYRVYSTEDITRIHRVLVYKELGCSLAEIGRVLDDPATDAREHLRRQRSLLVERIARLQAMVRAVDRVTEAADSGMRLTPQEQVEIFGSHWRPAWTEEAAERWGESAQWAQYLERAADKTPQDWKRVTAEADALTADLAAAKRTGVAPGTDEANTLAERHRASISQHYDCTRAMQVCIGRMHAEDPRFAEYYDTLEPGLAVWLRDVIFASAAAHGLDPASVTWE
ncbi:MerR family transcriptional regulator [Nonomuraea sp. NPDC050680]|uniref:MerR family transcriptional regulator n=1 Tax=Nonomuraea sp. NPDC050680 TaxID=3154630 RepID=UPI0034083A6D